MSKEALIEIIDRLIGDYEPIGETYHDDNSNHNLNLLCDLVYYYLEKIYFLIPNKNRVEYSVKTSGEIAENMFNILFEDFFEDWEKENGIEESTRNI